MRPRLVQTSPQDVPKLGIRVYYAEYPTTKSELDAYSDGETPMDEKYAGLHTLLMVPTYDETPDKHVDFDPDNNANTQCPTYSVFDTTYVGTDLLALAAQNHGGLAPPPYLCDGYWYLTGALFMQYVDIKDRNNSNSPTAYFTNCPPER